MLMGTTKATSWELSLSYCNIPYSVFRIDTLLDPESVVPFSRLFRVAANKSLLTAQLLTARSLLEREEPVIYSLLDLGDYLRSSHAFPLILECIAVAITIPVSSCSAERCFSAVKRILTACAPQCPMLVSRTSPFSPLTGQRSNIILIT